MFLKRVYAEWRLLFWCLLLLMTAQFFFMAKGIENVPFFLYHMFSKDHQPVDSTAVYLVKTRDGYLNHKQLSNREDEMLMNSAAYYYRLKQKDIDGRFTYSSIVALSIDDSKSIVMLYPNPVTTEANLTITINKAQQVQGRIIDNSGKMLKQMLWNITSGSTSLPVEVKGLASGTYYLDLKGETINERKIFVKQ